GLQRRFRNPNAAMLSKGQSYLLAAYLQIILWGFTLQYVKSYYPPYHPSTSPVPAYYDLNYQVSQNFPLIAFFNVLLLFGLIAVLSPHRQAIQDWARYWQQNISNSKQNRQNSLLQNLIWDEKSPALITILINLVIVTIPLAIWILLAPALNTHRTNNINWLIKVGSFKAILGLGLFITLMMIYATLAQRMLLMKTANRSLWAIATVAAAIFLPPMLLGMLGVNASKIPILWLFSSFPWIGIEYATTTTVFIALLGELSILVLFNLQLIRQVKLAGESATKALLAEA
ncbi:MAG: ABC transporter permease, partial [Fischerella sp.]|nr:ABC transporter permease [Fischerella sp.]